MGEGSGLLVGSSRAFGSFTCNQHSLAVVDVEHKDFAGIESVRRTKEVVKERATAGLMAARRAAAITVRCMNMAGRCDSSVQFGRDCWLGGWGGSSGLLSRDL